MNHEDLRGADVRVVPTSFPEVFAYLSRSQRVGEEQLDEVRQQVALGRVLMAAVGPITATPLRDAGLEPLIAERGRLGSLVRGVVTHFGGGRAPSLPTSAGRLELRSTGAVIDGSFTPLSRTGVAVLAALFDAGGGVVSRRDLQCALPRSSANAHAVEVAVARIREALAAPGIIRTVVKRGYRLDVLDVDDLEEAS